jgi:hypothetical protein
VPKRTASSPFTRTTIINGKNTAFRGVGLDAGGARDPLYVVARSAAFVMESDWPKTAYFQQWSSVAQQSPCSRLAKRWRRQAALGGGRTFL